MIPLLHLLVYSFALWLGLYLLGHSPHKAAPRYGGFGLVTYALSLALFIIITIDPAVLANQRWWGALAALPIMFWGLSLWALLRDRRESQLPRRPLLTFGLGSVFLGLGGALLVLPQNWLTTDLVLLTIGVDLLIIGYAIAALDAFDEGHALLPDMLRSLAAAGLGALVFGVQIAVVIVSDDEASPAMLTLLLTTLTTVIVAVVFAGRLRQLLDQIVFRESPQLQQTRAALQGVADALPRADESLALLDLPPDEFARLTRRALGHMGSLDRLVTSPLLRLPLIDERTQTAADPTNSLERAAILKTLLTESIERLKPATGDGAAHTTDEWRFYNALYYPYVLGLKPYSRRLLLDDLDVEMQEVMAWFRAQVPERTLYNWQNAAARLVAQDLREQLTAAGYLEPEPNRLP